MNAAPQVARARVACSAALLGLLTAGCGGEPAASLEPRVVQLVGEAMGTTWSVKYVGHGTVGEMARVRAAVEDELARIDEVFSTWRDDSEIARVNEVLGAPNRDGSAAADRAVDVSAEFGRLTSFGLRLAEGSEGAFDPTAAPLLDLYGFTGSGERRVPSDPELDEIRARVGHGALRVEESSDGSWKLVSRAGARRSLELSSIAKGHGVDCVSDALAVLGYADQFVEIGGEVRAHGMKPDGAPWRVGIELPATDAEGARAPGSVVTLRGAGLATSGSYRNYVQAGQGRRVHHVLDARTGRNADHDCVSVSVLAPSCAAADGWATALLILGSERGADLVSSRRAAGEQLSALFLVADPQPDDPTAVREVRVGWPGT